MSLLEDNIAGAIDVIRGLSELAADVDAASDLLTRVIDAGGLVTAAGNGGSAADAMHFMTELVCRFEHERRPYPAICLNASGGDLTAIANDFTYDEVFARPVRAFNGPGSLFIGITTSGRSPNVLAALHAARDRGASTLALLGRDGGDAAGLADVELCVQGPSTARIQEAHQILIHTLCGAVEANLASKG